MNVYEAYPRFAALFDGLRFAHGTGRGQWIKRPLRPEDWIGHLQGDGPGIGVAPLREDSTVAFAAIDLDEPDFDAARDMQRYIPGVSWLESSRSGNAHIWVFFSKACPAWLAMGVLKEATLAAGKKHVEVFPKNHDFTRVRLGNYINLPFHGDKRPILSSSIDTEDAGPPSLEQFLLEAHALRPDPENWLRRAELMQIGPPSERKSSATFGQAKTLHICAQHVIEHAEDNPVVEGHRAIVFFNLAKALTNWEQVDHEEALDIMRDVNRCSPTPSEDYELRRILRNAEEKQYTSTGCDDPLFGPYAHPDCPIANPRR